MSSLRDKEGYLLIDHRASPGLTPEQAKAFGYDPAQVGEGKILETATATCSHCQKIVLLNQARTRERAVCLKCYNYVCDGCALAAAHGESCRPWAQVIEETHEMAAQSFNIKVL